MILFHNNPYVSLLFEEEPETNQDNEPVRNFFSIGPIGRARAHIDGHEQVEGRLGKLQDDAT